MLYAIFQHPHLQCLYAEALMVASASRLVSREQSEYDRNVRTQRVA
jgi:hypothetical protein